MFIKHWCNKNSFFSKSVYFTAHYKWNLLILDAETYCVLVSTQCSCLSQFKPSFYNNTTVKHRGQRSVVTETNLHVTSETKERGFWSISADSNSDQSLIKLFPFLLSNFPLHLWSCSKHVTEQGSGNRAARCQQLSSCKDPLWKRWLTLRGKIKPEKPALC